MSVDPNDLDWAQAIAQAGLARDAYPRRLARDLIEANAQLAVPPVISTTPGLTGGIQVAVGGNPSRVYLGFAANTTNPIFVGITGDATGTPYAVILPPYGLLEFRFSDHGPLCSRQWYMYSADPAAVMAIYQVLVQP